MRRWALCTAMLVLLVGCRPSAEDACRRAAKVFKRCGDVGPGPMNDLQMKGCVDDIAALEARQARGAVRQLDQCGHIDRCQHATACLMMTLTGMQPPGEAAAPSGSGTAP